VLADSGCRVTGVDISPVQIARAQALVPHARIKPPIQCTKVVNLKNKNTVKYMYEFFKIPRTTAEKRDWYAVISNYRRDFVYVPKKMFLLPYSLVPLTLVDRFMDRFPCIWIAPIFQLSVAVEDVIAAPLQCFSHRGFAGAGHALDQIIVLPHGPYLVDMSLKDVP
jgi:hypothetical protein